ncbi:Thioredoxin domain-containing protein 9-like [Oopsacas minuta]|uniref:Thioredoxin domain-containing protein 9 n=1 Tax=Oopsacas minuta TaxID=111878 RepID=A0AAV7JWZ3_9METZ|nr:Thioredoxin domain-containing protein 9-like [Oopsacas minuta]
MATNQAAETALLKAAEIIEEQLDGEIDRLDKMGTDDIEKLREQRLKAMKDKAKKQQELVVKGHGTYREMPSEKDFFQEVKDTEFVLIHFFRPSTMRCDIVDKHLAILAAKHIETKFLKVNVEKFPFLVERLKIRVLPTIVPFVKGSVGEYLIGFELLGNRDDFSTDVMEWRLGVLGVIEYSGNLLEPPTDKKPASRIQIKPKTIRNRDPNSSDSDEYN